ncbi:MAG: calcium-binding protein [Planctomycetota bacterium]
MDHAGHRRGTLGIGTGLLAILTVLVQAGQAQPTWRVSVDSSGGEANAASNGHVLSGDGRLVAFQSLATNLVAGDTNGKIDIFVHDRSTKATKRVSVGSFGAEANDLSEAASVSFDGGLVAFQSSATNLVEGDTNGKIDIFVHDRTTRTTRLINVSSSGQQADGRSYSPAISGDGRFVAFSSFATNLVIGDTNGLTDVFVHDLQTGTTTRVSVDSSGGEANGHSGSLELSISHDGRFIAFPSEATNLVPGDTNGSRDVFVHDRETGTTTRVTVDSLGNEANGLSFNPVLSGDGRYVAYDSEADNLVVGDANQVRDVFVRDRQTSTTTRVSVGTSGVEGNGVSLRPSISADGRFIAFHSVATNLAPGNTSQLKSDIFRRDLQTGTTTLLSITSPGINTTQGCSNASISANGRFVAFSSSDDSLAPGDSNQERDIFVRDTLELSHNGVPSSGQPFHFTLSGLFGETGNTALVLLSCTGTEPGFELPGNAGTAYLTFDACTALGLNVGALLQGVVAADGTASTPVVPFPHVIPLTKVFAAAVTLKGGQIVAISSPTFCLTQ